MKPKVALISVYNKTGITEFAKSLVDLGWKVISSGSKKIYMITDCLSVESIETFNLISLSPLSN